MAETDRETEQQTRDTVRRLAADSFTEHAITLLADAPYAANGQSNTPKTSRVSLWRVAKPGTGIYGFNVLITRGTVTVYGDLGEYVLRMSADDPVEWLRGAVGSSGYLFEKVQAADRSRGDFKTWYLGDAKAWLDEQKADEAKDAQAQMDETGSDVGIPVYWHNVMVAFENWTGRVDDMDHRAWCELMQDESVDDAWSIGMGHGAGAWWLLECLSLFVQLHDKQPQGFKC